ncbi:hypothetical protein ACQ4WX_37720 [Streptomyces lasalocidi]
MTGKVIRPQQEPRSVRSGPRRHRHHAVTSTFTHPAGLWNSPGTYGRTADPAWD